MIIKAVSIRLSDKLHKVIKIKCFENDQSLQDYFVALAKKDLDLKDEDDDLSDYLPPKK